MGVNWRNSHGHTHAFGYLAPVLTSLQRRGFLLYISRSARSHMPSSHGGCGPSVSAQQARPVSIRVTQQKETVVETTTFAAEQAANRPGLRAWLSGRAQWVRTLLGKARDAFLRLVVKIKGAVNAVPTAAVAALTGAAALSRRAYELLVRVVRRTAEGAVSALGWAVKGAASAFGWVGRGAAWLVGLFSADAGNSIHHMVDAAVGRVHEVVDTAVGTVKLYTTIAEAAATCETGQRIARIGLGIVTILILLPLAMPAAAAKVAAAIPFAATIATKPAAAAAASGACIAAGAAAAVVFKRTEVAERWVEAEIMPFFREEEGRAAREDEEARAAREEASMAETPDKVVNVEADLRTGHVTVDVDDLDEEELELIQAEAAEQADIANVQLLIKGGCKKPTRAMAEEELRERGTAPRGAKGYSNSQIRTAMNELERLWHKAEAAMAAEATA